MTVAAATGRGVEPDVLPTAGVRLADQMKTFAGARGARNWKTSRMVAHYSAGATAERGAVARYL